MLARSYQLLTLILIIIGTGFVWANHPRSASAPYISGDSFRSLSDHILDETTPGLFLELSQIKPGDLIFVKTDYLPVFFLSHAPQITVPYILITHNSDLPAPNLTPELVRSLPNFKYLTAWFGVNPGAVKHPKFMPVPIGLANRGHPHGDVNTVSQVLREIAQIPALNLKKYLLCLNFNLTTGGPRLAAYQAFAKYSLVSGDQTVESRAQGSWCKIFVDRQNQGLADHKTYLTNMAQSKFVICPFGNGLDTHRTWEALLVGCYPVVLHSSLDELYTDLPVVIVNNWSDVTEQFLNQQYNLLQTKKFNWSKIYWAYWANLIQTKQRAIRAGS